VTPRLLIAVAAALLWSASGAFAAEYTIVLDKMAFGPVPEVLHPGDTITWQNNDALRHTATARDGSFDFNLPSKSSATMTVGAVGTVAFFCKFHPGMTGTLAITP
jgi:plastocyanin